LTWATGTDHDRRLEQIVPLPGNDIGRWYRPLNFAHGTDHDMGHGPVHDMRIFLIDTLYQIVDQAYGSDHGDITAQTMEWALSASHDTGHFLDRDLEPTVKTMTMFFMVFCPYLVCKTRTRGSPVTKPCNVMIFMTTGGFLVI
jgi:hypothetical protein